MAKAILVMDMPETCSACDLCYECIDCARRPDDIPYNIAKWLEIFTDARMPWCQLRLAPTVRKNEVIMYKTGQPLTDELIEELIDFGYNECLYDMELVEDEKETEMD